MGLYFVAASRKDDGFIRMEKGGGLSNKFGAEAYRTHRPGGIVAVPLPRAGGQDDRARPMFSIIVCASLRPPKEGTHESTLSTRGKGYYHVLTERPRGSDSKGAKTRHQLAEAPYGAKHAVWQRFNKAAEECRHRAAEEPARRPRRRPAVCNRAAAHSPSYHPERAATSSTTRPRSCCGAI
jgi:hypothetical protein